MTALGPFRERPFALLWTARTISGLGDALVPVTLAVAILDSGGGAGDIGLVLAVGTGGRLILLLVGGVWADRLQRRLVLISTDLTQAVFYGALGLLVIEGTARIWQYALVNLVAGMASAFFLPASSAVVPEVVKGPQIQSANALLGLSKSAASVIGPATAGLVIAVASPGILLLIDAGSFLASAALVSRLPLAGRTADLKKNFVQDLAEGWKAVARQRWYLLNLVAHGTSNLGVAVYFVLGPVLSVRTLGGSGAWGLISAATAAGSIIGGLVALRFRPRVPLIAANLALTVVVAPLIALALKLPLPLVALCAAVAFLGITFLNQVWTATVQQLFEPHVLARVSSYDWLISIVAMPTGYALAGPISAHIGSTRTLYAASLVVILPCVVALCLPSARDIRRLPDGTVARISALGGDASAGGQPRPPEPSEVDEPVTH